MKKFMTELLKKFSIALTAIIISVIVILIYGILITILWNIALVPAIGVSAISVWQGLGISILAKLLFGNIHIKNKF